MLPALELPARRVPPWLRPPGWRPMWGERVLFRQGGGYPTRSVRVWHDLGEDRVAVSFDLFYGSVPLDRLFPFRGWEEERERFARETSEEEIDPDPF